MKRKPILQILPVSPNQWLTNHDSCLTRRRSIVSHLKLSGWNVSVTLIFLCTVIPTELEVHHEEARRPTSKFDNILNKFLNI